MRALRVFCSPRAASAARTKDFPREAYSIFSSVCSISQNFFFLFSRSGVFLDRKKYSGTARCNRDDNRAKYTGDVEREWRSTMRKSISGIKAIETLCIRMKKKRKKKSRAIFSQAC